MKVAVVAVLCLAACVSGGLVAGPSVLVRTPSLDSAVIQSDRLGGNFAYSSVEGHAYAAITPVVQNVVRPVAVSYTAHQVPVGTVAVAQHNVVPVAHPGYFPVAHAPTYIPGIGASLIPGSGILVASPAASDNAPAKPAADAPASDSNDAVAVEAA
ncbi:uncharacterized protein [Anabrus simplex]|uniref:uncharacterized protein n=1 Tax=Anabrus simplex TaxID=316456 RepID=UPI0034DDC06C